jgi:dienelactone hydrolase
MARRSKELQLPCSTPVLGLAVVLTLSVTGAVLGGCSDGSGTSTRDAVDEAEVAAGDALDEAAEDAPVEAEPSAPTSEEVARPGPHRVGVVTLRLEDDSRPTLPNGDYAGAETRTLVTEVWYPATDGGDVFAPVRGAQPDASEVWPVLVYSHGFLSGRRENTELTAHLASLGVIVAAPEYPLTSMGAPGGANVADVVNQPADVRFLLAELRARGSAGDSPFGAVDPERVALMGVSLGGLTSLVAAFHPDHREAGVTAVLAAAAPTCYLPPALFAEASIPLALVHGDMDELVPYSENAPPAYSTAVPSKWLVTFVGGTHTAFGATAVDVLARLDNPEAIGCVALAVNPSISAEALAELAQDFGGVSPEQVAACPAPCAGEGERLSSMNARRQLDLFALTATAFFGEQLRGEARLGRFLDEGLAREHPDVRVEVQRR